MTHPLSPLPAAESLAGTRQPDSPQRAEVPRPFGRELTALPEELFDHLHLTPGCTAPAFTQDRFAATIAPWLDRFDSQLTQRLKHYYAHEAFPCIACAVVGTQLRKAAALHLEECETITEQGGVMVRVLPECYEFWASEVSADTPDTDKLYVESKAEDLGQVPRRAKGRLAPDQKHFVRISETTASIYEQNADGIWCAPTRLDHEKPIRFAQWIPRGPQLLTLSARQTKIWSRCPDNHWQATSIPVPLLHCAGVCPLFTPDCRTCILGSDNGIHVWWHCEDGRWTPTNFQHNLQASRIWFSQDSCQMATLVRETREDLTHLRIWSRTQQGEWNHEGALVTNYRTSCRTQAHKQVTAALNPQSYHLIAVPGHQALPGKPRGLAMEYINIRAVAFSIHGHLAVGYSLTLSTDAQSCFPWRTCVELWGISSQPWKKQAQLTTIKELCCTHADFEKNEPCGLLESLFFSPDGRFLVAKDVCERVQAWCLVPPAVQSFDAGGRVGSTRSTAA
ncbi:MAG: WD40 repeat domain-containing protein [Kistimonas sp.]|nr:WD40 repeat domain-containing protein [Kistimonas sp.]